MNIHRILLSQRFSTLNDLHYMVRSYLHHSETACLNSACVHSAHNSVGCDTVTVTLKSFFENIFTPLVVIFSHTLGSSHTRPPSLYLTILPPFWTQLIMWASSHDLPELTWYSKHTQKYSLVDGANKQQCLRGSTQLMQSISYLW